MVFTEKNFYLGHCNVRPCSHVSSFTKICLIQSTGVYSGFIGSEGGGGGPGGGAGATDQETFGFIYSHHYSTSDH